MTPLLGTLFKQFQARWKTNKVFVTKIVNHQDSNFPIWILHTLLPDADTNARAHADADRHDAVHTTNHRRSHSIQHYSVMDDIA